VPRTVQFDAYPLQHALDPAAAEVRPEKLGGKIRQLMRLIQNERIGRSQDVTEAVLLQNEIREQEVVVHDDDVGFLRRAPSGGHVTARKNPHNERRRSCRGST